MIEALAVNPHCLVFFADETGHEELADPNHSVFGIAGIAVMAADMDAKVRSPWRRLKADYFDGPDVALHASDLKTPSLEQVEAIGQFFRDGQFGRFAVTLNRETKKPDQLSHYSLERDRIGMDRSRS